MELLKTEKEVLSDKEILQLIENYEKDQIPRLDKLWKYYEGENETILNRKTPDPNNPDNKIPIPYGRKIITTFSGYAYRPKYITYKPIDMRTDIPENATPEETAEIEEQNLNAIKSKSFFKMLDKIYKINNEPIKTSRAGRNTGIFGVAYELVYIDASLDKKLNVEALPRFFSVDPREMILLYDFSSEPKKKMAIRFYSISKNKWKVEVYYRNTIKIYIRELKSAEEMARQNIVVEGIPMDPGRYKLIFEQEYPNFFKEIPVVAYYFGDEMKGLIEPVMPLIDAYDTLLSDSMNEFDRFAYAYLVMKKFGLTNPLDKKDPSKMSRTLKFLKRFRVFEHLPENADVSFLTKDIPTGFIDFMSKFIQNQIHVQSHVPDFAGEKFNGASGIAIQRLLFDFENVCSNAEADFDVGLYERISLIGTILKELGKPYSESGDINISHKRNCPLNLKEFADTALVMKNAGFSKFLVADIMPDDIIPDVDEELRRQKEDMEEMMPEYEPYPGEMNPEEGPLEEIPGEEEEELVE